MMTRINSQFEKTRKVSGPRSLQPSQWGMLCPSDTPEGESCGLVKNLSLLSSVTTDEDEEVIEDILRSLGVEGMCRLLAARQSHEICVYYVIWILLVLREMISVVEEKHPCIFCTDHHILTASELHSRGSYIIFLNGLLLGIHRHPKRLLTLFRRLRREGRIRPYIRCVGRQGYRGLCSFLPVVFPGSSCPLFPFSIVSSIYVNDVQRSITIASDSGRLCRPLIIVDKKRPRVQSQHIRVEYRV